MSKTFKALQRAAREQALRNHQELPEGSPLPAPPRAAPPSASRARVIALSGVMHDDGHSPPRPRALSATEDRGELRSEVDLPLREILELSFRPGCPDLEIGEDGWVRGRLEPGALLRLLRRHNLLHCLQKDEESTFWFWASAREAAELAMTTGYRLDPVDRSQLLRD